jgi:glycosyltransferase involved in cell wall biosynthesis
MRVLLLSAYDASSHRAWHQALTQGLQHWEWTVLTLPPRHFSWRVRGNPLSWAGGARATLEAEYDLLLATSMTDLATLRGLVPRLAALPTALYFHENQFAYPEGSGKHGLLEAQMVSLYAAMAADCLLFNSRWNRDSFLSGCEALLAKLPDQVPAGVVDGLRQRAQVLPVPVTVEVQTEKSSRPASEPLQLVWNHRWEYDKGPERLLDIAAAAARQGCRVHVVGQQFRRQPEAFAELHAVLSDTGALGQWGFVEDREAYLELLSRCDVVLSTASHDFQGLSVLEAACLGCTPLVPDQLAYPEWFPPQFRYRDSAEASEKLAALAALKAAGEALPQADVSALSMGELLPRYRETLAALAA